MKTIIIYFSQTGFTKKYAGWIAEDLGGEIMTLKDAEKKPSAFFDSYDAIIFGGWAMAGRVQKAGWFTQRISGWKGKRLALFCVGASPADNAETQKLLDNALTAEQKNHARAFYCRGGIDYSSMSIPSKLIMKAFASSLRNKKDATEQEKEMAQFVSNSSDCTDRRYISPIVSYIQGA